MKQHAEYGKYMARHKWYVFRKAQEYGVPLLGVIHDLSKFLPDEWVPYANFFYGGADGKGERDLRSKHAFDVAWLAHQNRNKHHWQYWLLVNDTEEPKVLEMPDRYIREMVADWYGAGMAISGRADTLSWYEVNKGRMTLGAETRVRVEELLIQDAAGALRKLVKTQ